MSRMIDYGAPACGTCECWQPVPLTQAANGIEQADRLGRCAHGSTPGWAGARRHSSMPFQDGCHREVGGGRSR